MTAEQAANATVSHQLSAPMQITTAILLGLVEGLTEFIPVSSTGHLILAGAWLGEEGEAAKLFDVVIQLGAILAILVLYWRKFWHILCTLRTRDSQHFVRNIALAFLPAAAIGALAHSTIKAALFNPTVVAAALIFGGVAILVIERIRPEPRIHSTETMPMRTALTIGLVQCVAMIPGMSRSGATIMGALMAGVERKTAAEFSFFLAVPTMLAASAYDLYKNGTALDPALWQAIAVGFGVSFLVALVVVRWLVGFVSRRGFAPFAWYRIALGLVLLGLMA